MSPVAPGSVGGRRSVLSTPRWRLGGMLITAFLPVYLSVKKQLGDRRGNEYASNLLTIVVALLAIVSVLCMVFAGQII